LEEWEKIKRITLFSSLSEKECKRLLPLLKVVTYRKGEVICREGEEGDTLYLIDEGKVRISQRVPGGGEETLTILNAGDVFGELALIDDAPRSADAIAHEDVRLYELKREDFEDLLFLDKELAYVVLLGMVRILAQRLRETNEKLKAFLALSRF
jgi:CRP-like cAMP-binding protein